MALDDDIRILSEVALFESFSVDQLRLLAFGVEYVRLAEGDELYRESMPADSAFVVVSGRIDLIRYQMGEPVVVGSAEPGAVLGEFALITVAKRLTSANAGADSVVMKLNRTLFRRILEEYPETAAALHQRIKEELQDLARRVEKMGSRFGV